MLKKNILFKTLEWVVFIVLLCLLGLVISPKLPFKNVPKSFVVTTGSMEPTIKTGSIVFVKNIDPTLIKKDDIIAFTSPNNSRDTILHRVNSIKSTNPLRFSTKGDANNAPDLWDVMDVGVKGVFFASIPYLGYIGSFIKTPLGFCLFVVLPAFLFILIQVFNIKKTIAQEVERKVAQTLKLKEKSKATNVDIKSVIIFITFLTSLVAFSTLKAIKASYSDSVTVSGITISIDNFFSEVNSPKSSINLYNIHSQKVHDFEIAVSATDDTAVKEIVLYYSFNLGPWQSFPEIITGSSGNFHFTSPLGDGLYSFESIATDIFNNQESIEKFNTWNNQVLVDTIAPTTNLDNASLIDHIYNGQDYLINGKFDDGMTGWTADGSPLSEHHIANVGPTTVINPSNDAFVLGSNSKSINGTDSLFQTVALPASASSTLSFSYRFLSHDTVDYDKFIVNLIGTSGSTIFENILNVGNLETSTFDYDTGWQTISRGINYLAGQTFKLLFTLIDTGETDEFSEYNSYVYLDNIKLSTLDLRVGETDTVSFLVSDLGSIIINSPSDTTLNTGENILNFSSDDSSGNVENPNHQSVLVMSPIVLNKINKNTISIFNNNQAENINVNIYSIDTGTTLIPLTGTIFSLHSMDIILSDTLPEFCEIKLYKNTELVDSTIISDLGNSIWQRQSDGLGTWVKINSPVDFNLESRLSVSKITLTVSGLATTLPDMHYTINYTDASGPQEIYGQILPNTIDINGTSARDFYLGTCSSGGTCLPSLGLGSSFVVTFNGLAKTFIFN